MAFESLTSEGRVEMALLFEGLARTLRTGTSDEVATAFEAAVAALVPEIRATVRLARENAEAVKKIDRALAAARRELEALRRAN